MDYDYHLCPFILTLLVGKNINGSKSWLDLGFMNLQASELLKIALILYISYVLSKNYRS